MKEIITYQCEVCGFVSIDRAKVERCECGDRPLPIGTPIKFRKMHAVYGSPSGVGEIMEVGRVSERTHFTRYRVKVVNSTTGNADALWVTSGDIRRALWD